MPFKDNETQRKYKREWYKKNIKKVVAEVARRKKELRAWFREFKKGLKCSVCGEDHPACIDFHHKDPSKKEIIVSQCYNRGWSIERTKKEIDKCQVVCRNCHAKIHWNN